MLTEIYRAAYDARYKPCEHAAAHAAGLEAVVKHATTQHLGPADVVLQRICEDLETEWGMSGLASDGDLYSDYAKEVARRFAAGHGKTEEPVAWSFELARAIDRTVGEYTNWGPPQLSYRKPSVPVGSIQNLTPLYSYPGTDLMPGRQWVEEAFQGFVNDPPSDDYQQGYLGALYVIAKEVFGMDVAPDVPPPPTPSKPAPHLRLVKS